MWKCSVRGKTNEKKRKSMGKVLNMIGNITIGKAMQQEIL